MLYRETRASKIHTGCKPVTNSQTQGCPSRILIHADIDIDTDIDVDIWRGYKNWKKQDLQVTFVSIFGRFV